MHPDYLSDISPVERRLSDLRGVYRDAGAWERAVAEGDPVIYTVQTVEPGNGEGDLHYGLGVIMPGRVGDEYHLTRGHYHEWRPAGEIYIGLSGVGLMVMENERGEAWTEPLGAGLIVSVPGYTAHRTVNTGSEPLRYIGVYPARAGHDYGSIAERNFRLVVVERDGVPVVMERG